MKKSAAVLAGLLLSGTTSARAADGDADREWQFEITPIAWFAGIDGDVTARGTTAHVSVSFSDLFHAVDVAAGLLTAIHYKRFAFYNQLDYSSLDTNNIDNPPAGGRLQSKSLLVNIAGGYQVDGPLHGSKFDLMVGARIYYFDNDLTVNGQGTFSQSKTIADPIFVVRSTLPITSWLRFSPTLAIGGGLGSSDLVYEVQPTFQFQITDLLAARAGFRRVYWKYQGPAVKFDGSLNGFLLGLGATF